MRRKPATAAIIAIIQSLRITSPPVSSGTGAAGTATKKIKHMKNVHKTRSASASVQTLTLLHYKRNMASQRKRSYANHTSLVLKLFGQDNKNKKINKINIF